jgi:hypothetical protein
LLSIRWTDGVGVAGQPVADLFVPLAGHRGLRLHLYRHADGLPFWLRRGPVALHYCLDSEGRDPFQDPDLRRFLLALGNRFRTAMRQREDSWIAQQMEAAGLPG